jgi:hypothetical protein
MTLPAGFGNIDWTDWVRGLLSSFVVGGSNAVVSGGIVSLNDPEKYAFGTFKFFELIGSVFVVSGTLNMLSFLRTKPLPELKTVTTTTQTTEVVKPAAVVVTTVEETHQEPIVPSPASPTSQGGL